MEKRMHEEGGRKIEKMKKGCFGIFQTTNALVLIVHALLKGGFWTYLFMQ